MDNSLQYTVFKYICLGTGYCFLGVKLSGREADHSPPSNAEVQNAWSYTSIPQYIFLAWCLVKSTGNNFPLSLPKPI